jgi:hypothetical protein
MDKLSGESSGISTTTVPVIFAIVILLVVIFIWVFMYLEPFEDEKESKPDEVPAPQIEVTPPTGPTESDCQFADEDNPIVGYTNHLQKTGQLDNAGVWANFFKENEQNDLYKKQGVITSEEQFKQNAYVEGQYGRWGLARLAADDRRQTTSPYVGTTRSLRAVKIRKSDSILPDKISDTFHPIM